MKKCPSCETLFQSERFVCPACGYVPAEVGDFIAFAPEVAESTNFFPAESFDHLYKAEAGNFWFRSRNRLIFWALDRFFRDASNMLEIGCGTGFVLEGIAYHRPALQLLGSELSICGLGYAAKRLKDKACLFQMDARHIPFENEFDVIGAFDVLEHIEEDGFVLSQMHQALSPGGGVLITVPQHKWMWSNVDSLSMHHRRYTVNELKRRLQKAGFDCVYATSFVSLLLPLMFFSRLRKIDNLEQADTQLNISRTFDRVLEMVMNFELSLIRIGARIPVGGSLMMIGRATVS